MKMKTYESCYIHSTLNNILDKLVQNLFYKEYKLENKVEISEDDIEKAAWIASILAFSPNEKHKTKSLSFAVLLLLKDPSSTLYINYCYVIISRIGDLPLGVHLKQVIEEDIDKFNVYFDEALNMELGLKRASSKILLHNKTIYISDFQKHLWELLQTNKHLSISAPTSSGKSFMVQSFIIENCVKKDKYHVLYVVPTRSLIYEVSNELKTQLKGHNTSVKTTFDAERKSMKEKEIFVLTPERCLKLIELRDKLHFNPDIIFFDEVQNMEDEERGVLFEFILNELSVCCSNSKIIIAGPLLEKLDETFNKISGLTSECVSSIFSSVFQIKAILRFSKTSKNKINVYLKSPSGNTINFTITSKLTLYSKIKSKKGMAVTDLIAQYACNSQNIVYSNRKASAERWADYLAKKDLNSPFFDPDEIEELTEYLKEEVHQDYLLISCLKKGIAFHHSCVPEIARIEIENLYREGKISNIVCTPTLLEGVNLPAQKLFLITNKKDEEEMEDFDFGNLIGRAGRIRSHFYGSIYCIENDDEPWVNQKLDFNHEKEIVPATTKALSENKQELFNNIQSSSTDIEIKSVAYTIILLRHKYLKSPIGTYEYLEDKGLNRKEIIYLLDKLDNSLKNIEIPKEIVHLNPTIDPLLQDILFEKIKEEGVENWMISKHPLQGSRLSKETERKLPFQEKSFYYQFENLVERLDSIFLIMKENTNDTFSNRLSPRQLVRLAVPWLKGQSYKKIIDINKNERDDIDSIIRNITSNINSYVRFELVKYFKLWSDVISSFLDDEAKETNKYYLSLPQMIEVGCCDPQALELINEGINRSIATKVVSQIPNNYRGSTKEWIKSNKKLLPKIMIKHLENSL